MLLLIPCSGAFAASDDSPPLATGAADDSPAPATGVVDDATLQLAVSINGRSTNLIGTFHQDAAGTLSIEPDELKALGLRPRQAAHDKSGRLPLDGLVGVTYEFDPVQQSIGFRAVDADLVPKRLEARPDPAKPAAVSPSGLGLVLNYSLYASFQNDSLFAIPSYQGLSGSFDARLSTRFGLLQQSFVAGTTAEDWYPSTVRLDSSWRYSDPERMQTYRAGDFISGGLPWTRPVRLGGLQFERDFTLRPDLVTLPVPDLSGSAAVPSTVEVYANNVRTFSQQVDAGPFQVVNLPTTVGPGLARIVVTGPGGQRSESDVPFYASSGLLAKDLSDYSVDVGYARTYFGTQSNSYDNRLMAAVTGRRGLTDQVTLEGHFEGGGGLLNGGLGAVFNTGPYGVGSLALAGSSYQGGYGGLVRASFETGGRDWRFFASSQRSFGDFEDIASVTAPPQEGDGVDPALWTGSTRPPKALDQLSLSLPTRIDDSSISLNFSNLEYEGGKHFAIAGLSYSRQMFADATASLSAFGDLANAGSYGVYASLSMPIGKTMSSTASAQSSASGTLYGAELSRQQGSAIGDYGWRVRDLEGDGAQRAAAVSVKTPIAQLQAGVQQVGDAAQVSAQADGALVLAGGGVFAANRVDDAFAVIDAGAAGVDVFSQNRLVGTTGPSGKILVGDLHAWQKNDLAIDPKNLPVDADVPTTEQQVVPSIGSGSVLKFGVTKSPAAAIVVLLDAAGKPIEAGTEVKLDATGEVFVAGYDGETYFTGLSAQNAFSIDQPDGNACHGGFAFKAAPGEQVRIDGGRCQ